MKESRNQLNTSSGTSPNNDKMAANALSTASAAVTQAYEASESLLVAQVAAANESQNTVVADWVKKLPQRIRRLILMQPLPVQLPVTCR